jgi:hypothetical protein
LDEQQRAAGFLTLELPDLAADPSQSRTDEAKSDQLVRTANRRR